MTTARFEASSVRPSVRHWAGRLRRSGLALVILAQTGCSILPRSGPMAGDIRDEANQSNSSNKFPFLLVPVTQQTVDTAAAYQPPTNPPPPPADRPKFLTIGPGDSLAITLYQAGAGGAFSSGSQTVTGGSGSSSPASASGPGPATSISGMTVDEDGDISFPYAGIVHVGGLTINEAENRILSRLQNQMVEPQIVITVMNDVTDQVVVTGAVKSPGKVTLTPGQETLLDVITSAGGPTNLPTDTWVELTRHGEKASIYLQDILEQPEYDITADPGDILNLVLQPRTYDVFGAVGKVGEFPIDPQGVTVAEGLVQASGTDDSLAAPQGLFLFRYEHPSVVHQLGLTAPAGSGDKVPVIYAFNLSQAPGYFLATEFPLRPGDLIYSSDARLIQWQKALSLFGAITSPLATGRSISK